jgi:hypothetical protein
MPSKRKVPSFLVTQRQKLAQQKAKKEQDRKQRNIDQYEKEKQQRTSKYGYSQHLMGGSSSNSYSTPLTRNFREFLEIAENCEEYKGNFVEEEEEV